LENVGVLVKILPGQCLQ